MGGPIDFCDLLCKFAEIPKEEGVDGSQSCRTFIALFCRKRKMLVHKNLPCRDKVLRRFPENKKRS